MSKSRTVLCDEMRVMVTHMAPMMTEAKIKEGHLEIHEEADTLPADMVREAHKWLTSIFEKEFQAVKTVKRLLPDDMWKRYKSWGDFGDHQEVVLLREKMIPFRKVIVSRERPEFFKKGVVNGIINATHSKKKA